MVPASYSKPNNGAQVTISTIFTLCVCSFEVVYLWVSWNAFRSLSLRCWLDTHMIPTWIGLPVSIFCCCHCRGSACEQKSHVSLLVWACTGSHCHDDNEAMVCCKCRFERFMKAYVFSTAGKSTWDLSIAFMDKHFQRNFILRSMIPISTSQISGNVALAKKMFRGGSVRTKARKHDYEDDDGDPYMISLTVPMLVLQLQYWPMVFLNVHPTWQMLRSVKSWDW